MNGIRHFIRRHLVRTYFVLAYAVTWTGIVLIVGPRGLGRGTISTPQFLLIWVAMLAGAGGVGLLLAAITGGRAGLRELLGGMQRWRVDPRWYALLLVVPLVAGSVLAVLAQTSPDFVPWIITASDKTIPLVMFLVVGFGTFVEELGWTGIATRHWRGRASALTIGLVVGLLWAVWHFMGDLTGSRATYGELFPLHFLAFWLVPLIAFRVLIVLVYDHTESLLLAQLMHMSYSPVLYVLGPASLSSVKAVTYESAFALVLCAVVAVVVVLERQQRAALPSAPVT